MSFLLLIIVVFISKATREEKLAALAAARHKTVDGEEARHKTAEKVAELKEKVWWIATGGIIFVDDAEHFRFNRRYDTVNHQSLADCCLAVL